MHLESLLYSIAFVRLENRLKRISRFFKGLQRILHELEHTKRKLKLQLPQ